VSASSGLDVTQDSGVIIACCKEPPHDRCGVWKNIPSNTNEPG